MNPFESIESLYTRNKDTNVLNWGSIREPEWSLINMWELTEKIDGTNIRVIVTNDGIKIKGRSDNAVVPADLHHSILHDILPTHEEIKAHFLRGKPGRAELADDWCVTFYGEGYGPGIQGSSKMDYRNSLKTKWFRCFDVKFGEKHWATPAEWRGLCDGLGIPQVPCLGLIGRLPSKREHALDTIDMFTEMSLTAREDSGNLIRPEGIVARPPVNLYNQWGGRLIWKLTLREFSKE